MVPAPAGGSSGCRCCTATARTCSRSCSFHGRGATRRSATARAVPRASRRPARAAPARRRRAQRCCSACRSGCRRCTSAAPPILAAMLVATLRLARSRSPTRLRAGGGPMSVAVMQPSAVALRLWIETDQAAHRAARAHHRPARHSCSLTAKGMPPARVFWGAGIGISLRGRRGRRLQAQSASTATSTGSWVRLHAADRHPAAARRPRTLGFLLAWLSWTILTVACNPLAAMVAMLNIFYYSIVYTVWLKRRTRQNIVIGGGAGASAPHHRVGRGDRPDRASPPCSSPRSCSSGLLRASGRCRSTVGTTTPRAGIPMLPVTHGEPETPPPDPAVPSGSCRSRWWPVRFRASARST